MRKFLLSLLFMLPEFCGIHVQSVQAEDDAKAFDVLDKAIQHSGEAMIRAGEFVYEVRSKGDVPAASEIAEVNRRAKEQLTAASDAATDPKIKKQLKELAESNNDFGPSMVANADLRLQFYFAFDGPLIGGDHYLERRTWDPVTKSFGSVDYSLVRRYGEGRSDCVWLDQHLSGKVGPVDDILAVQQAPHYLGRLSGTIMAVGPEIMKTRIESVELVEGREFEGHPAVELRCSVKDFHTPGVASIIYLVVPEMGYVVPTMQEFDAENGLLFEVSCQDYFQAVESDLFFPGKCTAVTVNKGERRVESYTFEPSNVNINVDVAESRFQVEIPPGADIYLTTTGQTLKAHDPVGVGIDDIEELAHHPAFHAFGASPPRVPLRAAASGSTLFGLIFVGGVLSCVVAAVLLRRQNNARAAAVLLIACTAGTQSGCVSEAKEVDQAAHPVVVDLGKVASEQQTAAFEFQITNPNSQPVAVDLIPSCSCTQMETPKLAIEPGHAERVKGRLLLHGKTGPFETQIHVRQATASSGDGGKCVVIRALILGQWVAMPKRVVLSPGRDGSLRLIAPSDRWADVSVQPAERGIRIRQISTRVDSEQNEIRDYVVELSDQNPADRRSSKIVLRNLDQPAPFLSVPVLIEGQGGLF